MTTIDSVNSGNKLRISCADKSGFTVLLVNARAIDFTIETWGGEIRSRGHSAGWGSQ